MDNFTYEYLPWRGVAKETMAFFDCKTKIGSDGAPISLGFKYPNGSYKCRLLSVKEFYTVGPINEGGLYGRDRFSSGSHRHVTIVEGEHDAHSLWQVLRSPVVSVQSANNASRDCIRDLEWLQGFETIYLAFDNDKAGHQALRSVARLFDYAKVRVVKFDLRKDPNDYLLHNEADELRNIWHNAKAYLPDTVISSFADFRKILKEPPKLGVPYPFPTLTEKTYGIHKGESVLVTAQEGVGKTELMHAIEYQLLKETKDAIGAIFLEEPKRRHLESLAGIALQKPAHLPDSGCTSDQIISAVEDMVASDDRLHLFSHFGSCDPELLLDTIRFLVSARGCGYILLDHITMVTSGIAIKDERRTLDYFATRLEMMVKELDFGLILVSHVNDEGQTRGSHYISKIADVRIDISRDLQSGSNVIHLIVSKSRFAGRTGPAGDYEFDPQTRRYTLIANDNYETERIAA